MTEWEQPKRKKEKKKKKKDEIQLDVVGSDGVKLVPELIVDSGDDGGVEAVRAAVASPVGVLLQRFQRQDVAHRAFLTLESAQIGAALGRVGTPGAVAFKELTLAQSGPPLHCTCRRRGRGTLFTGTLLSISL